MSINVADNIEKVIENRLFAESFLARLEVPVFTLFIGLATVYGWQIPVEAYWTGETGFGYLSGIIGGSLMLSQLLYSIRKNFHWMGAMALVAWSGLVGRHIYTRINCSNSYRSSAFALNEI